MKHSVLLLGASGMLGSMLLDIFSKDPAIKLTATVRNTDLLKKFQKIYPSVTFLVFDAEKDSFQSMLLEAKHIDWIMNAIGIIKPFIHEDNEEEVRKAYRTNAVFPSLIEQCIRFSSTKVIQIATDCVYSGNKENYTEEDIHDPVDIYGKTKNLGEIASSQFLYLRCSIIGPEQSTTKSLLEWFLHQPKNASIQGFTNHFWNGLTTLHFAKICLGIIKNNISGITTQHVIPKDAVTKAELLHIFTKAFQRQDVHITDKQADVSINRILGTVHDTINKHMWNAAGYPTPPTVKEMVEELVVYMKEGKRS